jgi:hypothetical protein
MMAAGALVLGAGCTTNNWVEISLRYTPLPAAESLNTGSAKTRIYVARFADARKSKDTLGAVYDSFGYKEWDIVTTDDFEMIVSEAVTDTLRKAGLEADLYSERAAGDTLSDQVTKGYDAVIGGRITTVEINSGWNTYAASARVVMQMTLRRSGKTEEVGPIEGSAERKSAGYTYESLLNDALQNCMRNMARHLKASGALKAN